MSASSSRALHTLAVTLLALTFMVPTGAAFGQEEPTTEWLSVDSGNIGGRELPAISADGRYVVFVGRAADKGVWVRDRVAGETAQLTKGDHFNPDISSDGTVVAYAQYGGSGQGIYVLDWQVGGATPELVTIADDGTPVHQVANFPTLNRDGSLVAFQIMDAGLDDDVSPGVQGGGPNKVYVRDRALGETEMVSVTNANEIINGNATFPAITPDGRYVVFTSDASALMPELPEVTTLAPDDEEDEVEAAAQVFRRDRQAGRTEMASVASDGTMGDGGSATGYGATVTDDGALVAFESDATNLVDDDTNVNTDAFVHSFADGSTIRVSVDETGDEVVLVNPVIPEPEPEPEASIAAAPEEGESVDTYSNAGAGPAISGDGMYVAFESDGKLTADDLNTPEPVAMYETEQGVTIAVYTPDVYRRGLGDDTLVRSSAAEDDGVEATGLRTDGMGTTAPANNGVDPAINVDGRLVAFVGNGNLNGEMPPPEEEEHEVLPADDPTDDPTEEPILLWEPSVWGQWDLTINTPPVALDDQFTTPHGRSLVLDVLANDTDANWDSLAITTVTAPTHGTATVTDTGKVLYVPDDGYVGADTFTYTIDDGYGGTDTAAVTMTVTNAAPIARADTANAVSGTPKTVNVLANDTDPDGDDLTITAVGDPTGGTATIVDDMIRYEPGDDFVGVDTFTYDVTDGIAVSSTTVTVTVTATAVGGVDVEVVRTFGDTRVETAVELSKYAFPNGADTVLLARSDQYPDALAGAPLAKALDAPILLTPPAQLADVVSGELVRLGADRVFLLGGEVALRPAVETALAQLGISTGRIAGPTRFETAAHIAGRVVATTGSDHAFVTEGADPDPMRGWPDALAISALAALEGDPILLVTTENVPTATPQALTDLAIDSATVVGGPVAVSAEVSDEIDAMLGFVDRLEGADRWATSAAIADAALAAGASAERTWIVTGLNYPDALVAGPLTARENGVLLLVHGVDLTQSPASQAWLTAHADELGTVRLVGGPAAISAAVATSIEALLP